MRNIFISFDIDDERMVNLLRYQAKDERFPFQFRDYSVKEPFEYRWKSEVRNLISLSSAVVVAIGKYTYLSDAVDWEIREAHRQNKQVIGVRLHRYSRHKIPQAMWSSDVVTTWNTRKIAHLLGEYY